MTLDQLKTNISEFKQKVQEFRYLLAKSRDSVMPEIRKNHQEIAQMRSELNAGYGKLEKFIKKFGNNPRMSDGVNPIVYPVYSNAFSNDILLRVGPSVDAVIQDLDYIEGKLNGMTESEFTGTLQPPKKKSSQTVPGRNYWHLTNPFWWLWEFIKWIWQHKVISITVVIIGLLAMDYSLAWRNLLWLKDFILGIM